MKLAILSVLLVLLAPFASACWIVHQIKEQDLAVWPLPAVIEIEPITLASVRPSKPALARIRITLIEERLKLPAFGKVQSILLKRYRSIADLDRENPESQIEILWSNGVLETTLPMSEFQAVQFRLVLVCGDVPAFNPCAGGNLIYEVQKTEPVPPPLSTAPAAGAPVASDAGTAKL